MKLFFKHKNASYSWDLFFLCSLLGIWPRFIEPNLLYLSRFTLPIPRLPKPLSGLKIIQVSDLHFGPQLSDRYLQRLRHKIHQETPDLIFFTGDFICRSELKDPTRLKTFLNSLKATYGRYAVLGNHDYTQYVSVNASGDYDIFEEENSQFNRGFKRFFKNLNLSGKATSHVNKLKPHPTLEEILQECHIHLLQNQTKTVQIEGHRINITGLGEHMLNRVEPEVAFSNCDPKLPTFVLVHNPDAIPKLTSYPGNLILAGHTHGGQINLPWIWKKVCVLENPQYKRGLFQEKGKWIYVSRGVGGTTPFRLFSPPEVVLFTLEEL
ncbi:hypothetical protein PHSC3_000943 [Chlamydiales bacterium STE3]|nr:hypothetical protein PHSC3_000943 [Chlamydiales bacterium STE3]